MSTTSLTAGEVMDRAAALMNDPAKTDYTYLAQLPYLNMAIDALMENLAEANASPSNQTSVGILVPVGANKITPIEHPETPHYPIDLVEIQEVMERSAGSNDSFVALARKEFLGAFPANQSLMFWTWEDQIIKFNPSGAVGPREVILKYVSAGIQSAESELTVIGTIGSRSYLSYKTAALCSMFVGENPSRAGILEDEANKALERLIGISNKGRQQMVTRHRPFRSSYKSRGFF